MFKIRTLFLAAAISIIGLWNCNAQELEGPILDKIIQRIEKRTANNESKIAELREKLAESKASRITAREERQKLRAENGTLRDRIGRGEGLLVILGKRLAVLAGWLALAVGILSAAIIAGTLTISWAYIKLRKQLGL